MKKKVSIIVPVYNTEKYLKKCLDSLVNQTLNDIEIILIDDYSNDKSRQIIQYYKNKYKDKIVSIFLEENKGVGFVRNKGIKISTGEYILFVDSDDYINKDMCEVLYKKAKEKDYDIVCFDFYNVINGKEKLQKLSYTSDINGFIDQIKRSILMNSRGYFWTRMYKREMIITNKIEFPIGIFFEDSPFNSMTLLYSNTVAKIDEGLYFYLNRNNSISNCRNKERLYDRIEAIEFMIQTVKDREIYEKNKDIIDKKYFKMLVGNIHLCLDMFDKPNSKKLKYISKCLNNNFKMYNKNIQYKSLDKMSKLYIYINEISPKLLIKIDKIYKVIIRILKK